jgi:hypothetical protein
VLYLPSPTGSQIAVSPLAIYDAMKGFKATFQVRHEAEGLRVLLSHEAAEVPDDAVVVSLRQAVEAVGALAPPVQVEHVATIPPDPSGKVPLIKSALPREVAPS